MAEEQSPYDGEPREQVDEAGEARGVLVVGRETVGRRVREASQPVCCEEERRDEDGRTHRMRVHPTICAGPSSYRCELWVLGSRKRPRHGVEGRVAVEKPGWQVDVVAVPVRTNGRGRDLAAVNRRVRQQRERAGDGHDVPYKETVDAATHHERVL
jgi:hypothetical protein